MPTACLILGDLRFPGFCGTLDAVNMDIMKNTAIVLLVALAFSSSAYARLRPRFPHHTYPPANGTPTSVETNDSIGKVARPLPQAPR